jgi:transcription elongation factor GreA
MAIKEKYIYLTQEGLDNLKKELEYLKTEKRLEIAERLKEAISY